MSVVTAENDELSIKHTAVVIEGENYDRGQEGFGDSTDGSYSDGEVATISRGPESTDPPDFLEWDITFEHDIPAENVGIQVRDDETQNDGAPELEWYFDGQVIDQINTLGVGLLLNWTDIASGHYSGPGYSGDGIESGITYTLGVEVTNADGQLDLYGYGVDVICVYDTRFNHSADAESNSFDNDVHEAGGYLDDPQLKPSLVEVELEPTNTRRDVTEARVASTWDDVTNEQYIALSNDGENYVQTNNSDSATAEFAEPSTSVFVKFGLSRYPVNTDPQNATPRFGYNGQSIDSYDLFANPDSILPSGIGTYDVRSVIPANQVNATLREGGLLSADDTLLSRSIYSGLDLDNRQLISNERGRFDSR